MISKFSFSKVFISIGLVSILTGCSEDEVDTLVITVDDAAEYVAASMAIATYGALYNMDYVADEVSVLLECNESDSNERTINESSNIGEITVDITISEDYSLSCSNESEIISYNFNADQLTTSERIDSNTEISGNWTVTGVESANNTLTYNGTYSRGGVWIYNLHDNRTDNVTTTFSYEEVKAGKDDNIIFEGTSTFMIDGSSSDSEAFSYEGNIVFLENNIAIATFATGEQYQIDLNNGDVTPL